VLYLLALGHLLLLALGQWGVLGPNDDMLRRIWFIPPLSWPGQLSL